MLIGFGLLLLGWIIPVLEVMQVLKSTFFFNFVSYLASFIGLNLGIYGALSYVSRSKRK